MPTDKTSGSTCIMCGIAEGKGRTAMLVELAGYTARGAECGANVTRAVNRLVSGVGGSAADSDVVTAADGNCGVTVHGTEIANSGEATTEPTTVVVEGKAKQTDWETTVHIRTSLLVRFASVLDCSSSG